MHERALVQSILRQIDDELQKRQLYKLCEVHLAVGEFSGIEPRLLEIALADLGLAHWPQPVALHCDLVPLTACCRACEREFPVERFHFACPACGGRQVDVIAGEDIHLVSLKAESIPELGYVST